MQKFDLKGKLSSKNTIIVLVSILIFVFVGMIAIAGGHMLYLDKQRAEITNTADFRIVNPQMLVYIYEDGEVSINFDEVVKVNRGATFAITKIIDEDGTVSPPINNTISVATKPTRVVMARITSPSKTKKIDYRITLVPKSLSNNVLNVQIGEGKLNGEILSNYSGQNDIILPDATKYYTSPEGDELEYEFLGWYTTEDYQDGTEIREIKAGSSGEINIYPKFAAPVPYRDARDGFVYVPYGLYPQTKVKDYNLLKQIKASAAYTSAGNGAQFTYNTEKYYKYKPDNQPNVIENGYSSTSFYVFKVEPVWWRVLVTANSPVNSGSTYTLLTRNIIACSPYSTSGVTASGEEITSEVDPKLKAKYDPNSAYESSNLRSAILGIYNSWIAPNANTSYVRTRTFTKFEVVSGGGDGEDTVEEETYTDASWALSYSEAFQTSYGFHSSWEEMDTKRQAVATDFALASGVYSSKTKAYVEKGSWWLRGSGNTYDYTHKRIAYVKYTGKLHSYMSLNYGLRSGVRPSINVQAWFSVA